MRLRLVLLTAAAFALVPAGTAQATTCVDTETILVQAARAVIAVPVSQEGDVVTFDVVEVVRGSVPDPLVARDRSSLTPEPLRYPLGVEMGLVLYERDGELLVHSCLHVPPARLRQARDEGWPRGVLRPWEPSLGTGGATAKMRFSCAGRCAGTLSLLAPDGAALGRRRLDLSAGAATLTIPLNATAKRRVSRRGRLPVRLVLRLRPVRRPVVHRLTLLWRP